MTAAQSGQPGQQIQDQHVDLLNIGPKGHGQPIAGQQALRLLLERLQRLAGATALIGIDGVLLQKSALDLYDISFQLPQQGVRVDRGTPGRQTLPKILHMKNTHES